MQPVEDAAEPELDQRELKALSRQERKEAKAALRREQQEARNAARHAKAMAKAAAKAARLAATEASAAAADTSEHAADEDVAEELPKAIPEDIQPTISRVTEEEETDVEAPESTEATEAPATDPRARAAQRVQRRLGKDAEKLSAAEARAQAREEARRRRAQAKEERSGVVAEEVVRPPAGPTEGNLAEDVSVVEMAGQAIEAELPGDESFVGQESAEEPFVEEPDVEDIEEPAIDEPVLDERAIDEPVEEPEADLPNPVIEQRIDEPAPVVDEEPEPAVAEEDEAESGGTSRWRGIVETREVPRHVATRSPMDDEEAPKGRPQLAPIAGVVGLIALGISVLLAVGALLVALGFDSGGLYEGLRTVANLLVGPLEGAFDFSGANAERKEHFLAWGAGSIGYLLISFVGQAVQRSNDED